jgi:hypothetical protein
MSKEWDFYFARVNDELASLFVDLGIRDSVPDPLRTYLVWCWVYMNQARSDGLSSASEAPVLGTIEDDLVRSLREQALFVGRITTAGRREFYFYTEDPPPCEHAIEHAVGRHAAYRFDLGSKLDAPWSQYLDLLYPSPEELQRIKNRRTVEVLEKNGDQLTKARPVSHWAYFATPVDRNAFLVEVTRRGFTIADDSTNTGEPSPRPYGIKVEKVGSIDKIDDVTIELFRLALLHDGEYDGWETSVEKTS